MEKDKNTLIMEICYLKENFTIIKNGIEKDIIKMKMTLKKRKLRVMKKMKKKRKKVVKMKVMKMMIIVKKVLII